MSSNVEGPHREPVALGGAPTHTLHAGALQVLIEGAATLVAGQQPAPDRLAIADLTTQFLAPARLAPIAALGFSPRSRYCQPTDGRRAWPGLAWQRNRTRRM